MGTAARAMFVGWTVLIIALLFAGAGSFSIYHLLIMLAPGWAIAAVLWAISRMK